MEMKMLPKGERYRTIVKLKDGLEIKVNALNWVLYIPPKTHWFYSTLQSLANDLLDYQIKKFAIEDQKKTIVALGENIEKAKKYVWSQIKPLTIIKIEETERLKGNGDKKND